MTHPQDGYSYAGCDCLSCRGIRRVALQPGLQATVADFVRIARERARHEYEEDARANAVINEDVGRAT